MVAERVSTFDEMLTTLVNAALAEVTTRQNEDMRKISAWAAIALVPTAIAGIYGMNFDAHARAELDFRVSDGPGCDRRDVRDAVHAVSPARLAVTPTRAPPRIRSTSEFDTCPSPNCGRPSDAGVKAIRPVCQDFTGLRASPDRCKSRARIAAARKPGRTTPAANLEEHLVENFWSIIWIVIWSFVFVAYLFVLFYILTDLFRDRELSGWCKALWIIFLIFAPYLTALVYIIARGSGMSERQLAARTAGAERRPTRTSAGRRRRQVAGGPHRRRQGAAGQRHDQPGRVRAAQGQGARLIVRSRDSKRPGRGILPAGRSALLYRLRRDSAAAVRCGGN